MMTTLFWLQGGACGGDSMALLNGGSPSFAEVLAQLDVEVLWHPSLSNGSSAAYSALIERILSGEQALDVLCVEGSVIRGPGGTGMYHTASGKPTKDLIAALAAQAGYVVAVGTCASFGGPGADGEIQATGLQYHRQWPGGFLGEDFKSGAGAPVVNLAGCPCHGDVIVGALASLVLGADLQLGRYNRPSQWYGPLVHQGCVRNEYHEYRVEERDFGERGCLFFHRGCRGPLTHGPCNKMLWNGRSSKTYVGVPCHGCTEPNFPSKHPFFQTRSIEDVPIDLPEGVDRAHYLAYKSMAAAAAPLRLKTRDTEV